MGTCKDVLANGFLFWSTSACNLAVLQQHGLPPFVQFTYCLLLTLSIRATNPNKSEQGQGNIGMQNMLSPYTGHCWRTVLCMFLGPLLFQAPLPFHISHVPAYGSLGWQVVSALQVPSHRHCPQLLASGSLVPPNSKQCSHGQQKSH